MKFKLFIYLLFVGFSTQVIAQGGRPADPLLDELVNQKDTVVLAEKLKNLETSGQENDLILLNKYYKAIKDQHRSDLVYKTIKQKFPNGFTAFDEASSEIYDEKDPIKNERMYKALVSRFSVNPELKGNKMFDYSKYYVAVTFLGKNNTAKVMEYLNMIDDTLYRTKAYSYAARETITTGESLLGEKLIKMTFADLKRRNTPKPEGYLEYARIAAKLLFLNGKYEEGFPYAKEAYAGYPKWAEVRNNYLDYLVVENQLKEAYPMMETDIRAGNASTFVKSKFKAAYIAVNGNDNGFKEHEASLYASLKQGIEEELIKKMINIPAFNFSLHDLNGNTVSLSDYKGKVVILDFWATWCGPCKAAFPNMQAAVTKYKSDPNVAFLFIHTWEASANPAKAAGDYIAEKKYTFHVLMDTKDPVTKVNPAAAGYKFQGIPAKFVIDKTGNIRFSLTGGGAGGGDAFLEEMSTMIELAKKPL